MVGSTEELIGAAAILVATMGYAAGPMIVKNRFASADPIGPIAGALGIATLLLLPAAPPAPHGGPPVTPASMPCSASCAPQSPS